MKQRFKIFSAGLQFYPGGTGLYRESLTAKDYADGHILFSDLAAR
jgi:hypothetical protein